MSIITLFGNNPELMNGRSTTADVLDAQSVSASSDVSPLPDLTDYDAWENILVGMHTNTGQIVTPERARRCATVLAIMRGLEEDISSLTLPLMKRGPLEDVRAVNHPVDRLLNVAPNALMTPMEVRGRMMFHFMLYGGFFILKNMATEYDRIGEIDSFWPLDPAYIVRRTFQTVWDFSDPVTGRVGAFTQDDVWRGTILSSNGIDGTAITLLCKEAIGLLIAAEEQGARLFSHGVQTDLALEHPDEMGDEEKAQLRAAFMARHAGSRNAWMPILLEGGVKATKLGLTAQESQYLDARAFQASDIARVFRYPEVLLGTIGKGSKSATFASAEQFFESYTKHTLGPWATRIEQTANRDLLTQKEQTRFYTRHDFNSLLKANETARIENWNKKIQGGWAQPAEARRAEGMPYKPGLEYFSRPAGSTGNADASGAPNPAPTDQSALALARRVASHLLNKEQKALLVNKQDADAFYTNFGGYIESLTGADSIAVRSYLETRRNMPEVERFTTGVDAALSTLISLC